MDRLTKRRALQEITPTKQPWSRHRSAVENPLAAASVAEPDQASFEDQIQVCVEHHRRASYPSFLATIDEEEDREEDKHPQPKRKLKITSGKLRTADTTAVKQVIWPH